MLLKVLPLQQVCLVLFSNQLNEELANGLEDDKIPVKKITDLDDHFLFSANTDLRLSIFASSTTYILYTCDIPANYAGDVQAPPPNLDQVSLQIA